MARLIGHAPDGANLIWDLPPGTTKAGRNPANPLCLDDASVSSFHCEISVNGDQIEVKDLQSTNGTFVDGQRVEAATLLPGQRLQLGSVELVYEADAADEPAAAATVAVNSVALAAPPIPRPVTPCRYHPEVSAQWICSRCRQQFCDGCLKVRQVGSRTWRLCPLCQGDCTPLEAALAAEAQHQTEAGRTFFQRLPGAFRYPLAKDGLGLLIGGTVLFWLLDVAKFLAAFAGPFGLLATLILFVFSFGYLFAYMQRIVMATSQDDDRLPDWPEFSDWGSDILRPCLMFLATLLICFGPPLVFMGFSARSDGELNPVWFYALLAFGFLYFPMALLAVAVSDNFFGVNPFVVLPAIMRIPGQYLVTVLVFFSLVAARHFSEILLDEVPVPILSSLLVSFLSLYFLTVEMRILGLLALTNRSRLAWFEG